MAKNIKERIAVLTEVDEIVETLNNGIEMYEKWADGQDISEELANGYRSTAMIKTKVRDMILKLADTV